MKKSVLFSTIAMIVVVVVALSTATYAWFSSATTTQAGQEISTTATAGITVVTNQTVFENTTTNAAFTGTNLLEKTYVANSVPQDGLRSGLWAPVVSSALIYSSQAPTTNTATTAKPSALVNFTQGKQSIDGTVYTVDTASQAMSPDLIRVTNNKSTDLQHIYLNIYIAANADIPSYYAAQGVSFYISKFGTAAAAIANTKYGYLSSSATPATKGTGNEGAGIEDGDTVTINNTNFPTAIAASGISSTYNHRDLATADPGYGWLGNLVANMAAGDVKDALNSYVAYYVISIDLGAFNVGQSANFYLYTWLDGTYLDDAAGNAGIKILYSFAETAKTENGADPA